MEFAIRGTHAITVSVSDADRSAEFIESGWTAHLVGEEHDRSRFELDQGGTGRIIDMVVESGLAQGTWTFGEGTVHHCAFQVDDYAAQDGVKAHLEGLGYTDVSERKDRGYFESVYVRTPGGPLFEATVSKPEGMLIDEPYETLGTSFQVPPVFSDQAEWILGYLEHARRLNIHRSTLLAGCKAVRGPHIEEGDGRPDEPFRSHRPTRP